MLVLLAKWVPANKKNNNILQSWRITVKTTIKNVHFLLGDDAKGRNQENLLRGVKI